MKRVMGFLVLCGVIAFVVPAFWLVGSHYPSNEITTSEYYQISSLTAVQPGLEPMVVLMLRDNKISREEFNQIMGTYNQLQEETDAARRRDNKDRLRGGK